MRRKHVYYDLAKTRLVNRLIRIMGAYRLGNISLKTALQQSSKAFHTILADVQRYTVHVQARRDLGDAFKPLSAEALQQLEDEIAVKQQVFKEILKDAKT